LQNVFASNRVAPLDLKATCLLSLFLSWRLQIGLRRTLYKRDLIPRLPCPRLSTRLSLSLTSHLAGCKVAVLLTLVSLHSGKVMVFLFSSSSDGCVCCPAVLQVVAHFVCLPPCHSGCAGVVTRNHSVNNARIPGISTLVSLKFAY
jgi:hypothetical protein